MMFKVFEYIKVLLKNNEHGLVEYHGLMWFSNIMRYCDFGLLY